MVLLRPHAELKKDYPQPAQLRFHFPAGFVHMRQYTAPRRIPQRMPRRFGFARHPLDRPANPAPAHGQSKAVFENGGGIGMRQSQGFVHQHAQRHRLRSYLHGGRSQGIGSFVPEIEEGSDGALARPLGKKDRIAFPKC
jgi:hypothetical protein